MYVRNRRPITKRKPQRGKMGGKRRKRTTTRPRRTLNSNKQDRATVIECTDHAAVPEGGNFITHSLSSYDRAMAVSRNYRFYRCKKVELEFIPYANVFSPGTAFPEMYFQIDRTMGLGNSGIPLPVPTKNIMLSRGVMPVRWTSIVKRSYTPSVLRNENFVQSNNGGIQSIYSIASTPVFNKWYNTQKYAVPPPPASDTEINPSYDPSILTYFGACYFIDQALAQPEAILGTVKLRVHWEFKEPLVTTEPTAEYQSTA